MKRTWLILGLLLSSSSCEPAPASGPGALLGLWRGDVAGIGVTVDVTENYGQVLSGTLSTTKTACFNSGTLSATLANSSVMMASSGSGPYSSFTIVSVAGELIDGEIGGLFSMSTGTPASTTHDECNVAETPIVLAR
jgi:hypothetical protein